MLDVFAFLSIGKPGILSYGAYACENVPTFFETASCIRVVTFLLTYCCFEFDSLLF